MKIKKILVPIDGSENSLKSFRHAVDLAGNFDASVVSLHVVTNMSAFAAVHPLVINENKWTVNVKTIMDDARKIASQGKVAHQEVVIGGMAAGYDIVTYADSKSNAIDLVVMARRGLILPKESFPGSTTNFVIHKLKVPILLVR